MADAQLFLPPDTKAKLLYATDCWDSETEARLIAWMNLLDHERIRISKNGVLSVTPLRQSHVGAILASYYFERRLLEDTLGLRDPEPMIFLGNAAPRAADNPSGTGTRFVFASLQANVFYFGTWGPELAWVKPHILHLRELDIEYKNASTVFRSRFLIQIVSRWLKHDESVFVNSIDLSQIPSPDRFTVFSIDSFGNIKLSLLASDPAFSELSLGQDVFIEVQGVARKARISKSLGAGEKYQLLLAPGSSKRGLGDNDFGVDLYCQEGNAMEVFKSDGITINPGDPFRLYTA